MTFGNAHQHPKVLVVYLIAVLFGAMLIPAPAAGQSYPYTILSQAYKAAEFDPAGPNCFIFVANADIH